MITVRILGGLGNQMFQYAFGRYLSYKKKTVSLLNYYYQIIRPDFDGENLTKITDVFNLPVELCFGKKRKDIINKYHLNYLDQLFDRIYLRTTNLINEKNYLYSKKKIEHDKYFYLVGYWQSEEYFIEIENIIRNDFKFRIEEDISDLDIYKDIDKNNSVSIHIRGNDYIKSEHYYNCDNAYYLKSMNFISKLHSNLKYYIFTDDFNYVDKNFKEILKYSELVDVKTSYKTEVVDLLLMSKCKHNIIANSSFSWWGGWLNTNPNKIVVSPKNWFHRNKLDGKISIPQKWIQI